MTKLVTPLPNGFRSCWLPVDQLHDVGRAALFLPFRGDYWRGTMWTDDGRPGALLRTEYQWLSPGSYQWLLQHRAKKPGQRLGSLIVEASDQRTPIATEPVVARSASYGDWGRTIVRFTLDVPRSVRVRFDYVGERAVWTGALQLSRGGARPVFIIGHNRNTPEQAKRSLDSGANALEVDLSYRDGRIMAAELWPFPGWREVSEAADWLRYVQSRREEWAFLYLDCKLSHVPNEDFRRLGKDIVGLLRAADVPAERCVFSIPEAQGAALYAGVKDSGFTGSSFCMDGIADNHPLLAPADAWIRTARELDLHTVGMGRIGLELEKPLHLWWPVVRNTVSARDRAELPHKLIFWSLREKGSMRKMLDLGVDGMIVDREDRAAAVLEEEPYKQLVRLAEPGEWDPSRAFGI